MVGNPKFTRHDTVELKDLIYRKIGNQRAEEYFDQLKRFLGGKLNKPDFDKSCVKTVGRENISIHNRLIHSIIQNAHRAKKAPLTAHKVENPSVQFPNGYQITCLQSLYGNSFPQSPRKCRSSVFRERKFQERRSPLGPLGKSPSLTCEETVSRIQEQQSPTELHSLCSKPPVVEDGEEVEQLSISRNIPIWSHVTAPLGMPLNSHKVSNCVMDSFSDTCQNKGELPDTGSLISCLQKKLAIEGLGISVDCADLLNKSLDLYLKRIIELCIGIAGSRGTDPRILGSSKNRMLSGLNGQREIQQNHASVLDFRVAMESNPRVLGEDWPVQLETICHYSYGE